MADQKALFQKYIATRKVLIVDSNGASRAGFARTMIDLGAKSKNVIMASSYADGDEQIRKHQPHIVICDYELGSACGLDLLQQHRKERPDSKDTLFVLVTGNTSQAAVAKAAEEDVDAFILKPYTIEVVRQTVMKVALAKVHPSEYTVAIDEGKALLLSGKPDEAIVKLKHAMTLNDKPALACFYLGQAELFKKAVESATSDYTQGLSYNKIHYKCLVGLFELFMERKMYVEAYEVVKKVSRYFPANPQRLASVLRLAVMTKQYEDIERYYQVFTSLDQRNDELIRYICAALVVCGKYYLQTRVPSRALELFQKAGITAAGRVKILREIIQSLAGYGLYKDASEYLKRFPADTQSGPDYQAMNYLILDRTAPVGVMVELGRKLIEAQDCDPLVYRILIRRSVDAQFKEAAEQLAQQATSKWPKLTAEFKKELAGSQETAQGA